MHVDCVSQKNPLEEVLSQKLYFRSDFDFWSIWLDLVGLCRIRSDSVAFARTWSDLVGFGRFGRTWLESVGFGQTWSDLVGLGRIRSEWSDPVGFGRIRLE